MSNPMFDVIQSDLDELNEGLIGAVSSSVELVNEVGTHLVTAGGKRIRPALCLLSARGGSKFSLKKVLPLAEALELIHTASLVHDDVIDDSELRRGVTTIRKSFSDTASILSGDYLVSEAVEILLNINIIQDQIQE